MPLTTADARSEWGRFAEGSVERRMLVALGDDLGLRLRPRPMQLDERNRVEVEGMDPEGTVVVQLIGNQGTYKPAYRNKVLADCAKLAWLLRSVPTAERAVLVVTGLVAQAFGGWVATAAADLGIEVVVFDGNHVVPLAEHRAAAPGPSAAVPDQPAAVPEQHQPPRPPER
ncbi:hypothetical protein DEI93_15585 [Curtobacterium sp. MCBD17_035]|uniref:hypothetical protein n=1 Tax=Curtobacterium sp. MCBD17_035 TaxID=2175673 RepID=UPI001C64C599|nr:hypothetical protein [Curtobacterium sp. MCBD17_035]WIB67356.1 hypothetical protein DEI93_15585 [Curtobacterium sp. MCBD17_035]